MQVLQWLAILSSSTLLKNSAVLTVGSLGAQLVNFLTIFYISKTYDDSQFGVYSAFYAIAMIFSALVSLRFEVNVLLPKEDSEACTVVILGVLVSLFLGLSILFGLYFVPEELITLGQQGLERNWIYVAVIVGVGSSIISLAYAWLNRVGLYKLSAFMRVIQSLAFLALVIIFSFWDVSDGLLWAQLVAVILFSFLIAKNFPYQRKFDIGQARTVLRRYLNISKYTFPAAVIDTVTLQAPVLLINFLFGSSAAGQFSLAWRTLVVPSSIIGSSVGQVFFQRFARTWSDVIEARKLLTKTWKALAIIGIVPSLMILTNGERIFIWVFGESWASSGVMASILILMIYASFIHSATSSTAIVLGLQKKVLYFTLVLSLSRPLSFYIGWLSDDLTLALLFFSLSEVFLYLTYQSWVYQRIINYQGNKMGDLL
jgi:lipopolysaccharide exporter